MKSEIKNYYKILYLGQDANHEDIRKSFRDLVKKWHPDLNKSSQAHDMIIEINEAYEILSDPIKRKTYDKIYNTVFIDENKPINAPNYKSQLDQIIDWSFKSRQGAEKIIKDGYEVFDKTIEAGIKATKTGFNIISTIIGFLCIASLIVLSIIFLYDKIILGKDVKLNGGIIIGLLITLFFTVLIIFNIYWAIKGEDSIFRNREQDKD